MEIKLGLGDSIRITFEDTREAVSVDYHIVGPDTIRVRSIIPCRELKEVVLHHDRFKAHPK